MAAAGVASRIQLRRDDIFASVFPPVSFTTPTPETTPNIGVLASPGKAFGGFSSGANTADDVVKHARAWSTATRFLTLPVELRQGLADIRTSSSVSAAFALLLHGLQTKQDLLEWYTNELTNHFRRHVLAELSAWQHPIPASSANEVLNITATVLDNARRYYTATLGALVNSASNGDLEAMLRAFCARVVERLHTLVLSSLPRQRLQRTMAHVFYRQLKAGMESADDPEECLKARKCRCPLSLGSLPLAQLHSVGLGNSLAEQAFALAIHRFLKGPAVERKGFEVDWTGRLPRMDLLRCWTYHCFMPFVERTLRTLTGQPAYKMTELEYENFGMIAVASLGRKRTTALFDYVKAWPDSTGAILDLREYIRLRSYEEIAQLCTSFVNQCQMRLLHAGASTTEILSIYVNVIHAFRLLDARGVLLEKVAVPLRNYLRSRADTATIIAASFLAEVDEHGALAAADSEKVCTDITAELDNPFPAPEEKSTQWDDMAWTPDPIDAGPDYKAPKNEDVIAYVLGLFDPEDFAKELTNVLAHHLLWSTNVGYVKETGLVELLKSRMGEGRLQAPEVMLKDMRDSVSLNKRLNLNARVRVVEPPSAMEIKEAIPEEGITLSGLYGNFDKRIKQAPFHAMLITVANRRQDLWFAKRTRARGEDLWLPDKGEKRVDAVDFNVQVLSSFFWPQMRDNEFDIPDTLGQREIDFEQRFDQLGSQRKIQFKRALGTVDVELELEDRKVSETDVPLWRATIIDAIASWDDELGGNAVEMLAGQCRMEEELVLDALSYWVGKRVLYRPQPGAYAILERRPDMDTASVAQDLYQQGAESTSAVKSQDAMLRENQPMFETFIANMLRNGGPKAVEGMMGVTNMLKMVLPTFTYGDDEVRWLLRGMEGKGTVRREGEMWAVIG